AESPASEGFFSAGDGDRLHFDLPAYVLARLGRAGVVQAEWIGADTYADAGRFYSNRRALHRGEADFGRLLSAISLV
ncbi:MAG: laccase domain-containing protein, partial [Phenylobacterium sp.]|nr:laccase domain-containing protein [Phenylobacterium sp.]